MAVLPRMYLNCVLNVFPDRGAAEVGERAGGTGFLVARLTGQRGQAFLVGNRHVIEPMLEPCVRVKRRSGGSTVIPMPKGAWRNHPEGDDLSAIQVDLSPDLYEVAWVYEGGFATPSIVTHHNIGLGSQVVMLGRLSTLDGRVCNMPSARFGHISLLPSDPVENDFGHLQETFVAEYCSVAGYSGSPVFVYLPSNTFSEEELLHSALGPWLLGINWRRFDSGASEAGGDGGELINCHTGMSGVIPAWRIASLLSLFEVAG